MTGMSVYTYIETISHPVARAVKIADLRHNLDATRVEDAETVDRRKYGTALSLLLDGAGLARSYETDRLVLLSSDVELAVPVVDYLVRNRAFLESFEPLRPEVYFTLEGQRTELAKYAEQAEAGTEYRYWISLKNDPSRIIGMVGASGIVMGAFRSCYLSYKLDKTLLRRNLMSEALGRFVRALFDDAALHRVEANIMPRNLPSLAVARKLGFVEGLSQYLRSTGAGGSCAWFCQRDEETILTIDAFPAVTVTGVRSVGIDLSIRSSFFRPTARTIFQSDQRMFLPPMGVDGWRAFRIADEQFSLIGVKRRSTLLFPEVVFVVSFETD